ncbi:MAG: TolC family protein [Microcoleaceae cyanobacterium]
MPVFQNLMAVGVSGLFTFAMLGQGVIAATLDKTSGKFSSENSASMPSFKQNSTKAIQNSSSSSKTAQILGSLSTESLRVILGQVPESHGSDPRSGEILLEQNFDQRSEARMPSDQMVLELAKPGSTSKSAPFPAPSEFKRNLAQQNPAKQSSASLNLAKQNLAKAQPESSSPISSIPQTEPSSPLANPANPANSSSTSQAIVEVATPSDSLAVPSARPPVNSPEFPNSEAAATQTLPSPNLDFLNPLTSNQVAQVSEPVLQIPDLTPPTEPFPQPTPNGTLETQPPNVVLPSANPLYFPTQTSQVEIQESIPITLEQALDLARRNNENLRVFGLQVEQSLAQVRTAQAALYPTLSFSSNLARTESAGTTIATRASNRRIRTQNKQRQLINELQNEERGAANPPLPPLPSPEPVNTSIPFGIVTFDNALQLSYDFGIDGRRAARIRTAEGQLRSSQLEFERRAEELRFNIADAYYNLQEADAGVDIQQAAVRNAQKSLEDAEALERAGVGTRFEVLQARVTLANNQQNLTNAISLQRRRRRELATLLNISQNINLIAADAIALAGAWDLTIEETIVQAYGNRAELEQELVNRNIAKEQQEEALGAQRPNLTASAQYNVLGQLSDDQSPFANQGWADGYAVQVQLSWNFFDGGAAKARGRQQELEIAIAEERFSQLRNQVRLEVESAFYDLQANFENIGVADLGVDEATEALRLARLRFQAGVGTQLDVINQETDLTRAQNQLLQAIIGYNRALSSLQRAVSNLPGSNLQNVP